MGLGAHLTALAVPLAFSTAASASEAFRCGAHVILDGDDKVLVVMYCGEPKAKEDTR